jgi:uncharacterized protein YcbX
VKGFTPEPLPFVDLEPEVGFPFDRLWAVENGPSGFDAAAPAFIPKQMFTVLASLPDVAKVRTRLHDATGTLEAQAPGAAPFLGRLDEPAGRAAFAAWLAEVLGEAAPGPLKVVRAPGEWRFTDNPRAQVSIINLASVADLARRMGVALDPLRFRANLYVEGWPAWAENDWVGRRLMLGWATAEVFKPIVRCIATHVDPKTGVRDADVTRGLFENYGHVLCGIYVRMATAGRISLGDAATAPQEATAWA